MEKINESKINENKKMRYAGFWIRLLAFFLDGIILGIPLLLLDVTWTLLTGYDQITFVFGFLYWMLIIYLEGTRGGTPGKLVLGLKIVDDKGNYIGVPNAILRNAGKTLSALILGIGHLMIIWDSKKQALHDKIAETYVVWK